MSSEHKVTLEQLVRFCKLYRTPLVFRDWTEEQIANTIYDCARSGTMSYSVNDITKQINGIVLAYKHPEKPNVLVINDILITEAGVLKRFIKYFKEKFPGYVLHGTDLHKRYKEYYNTPRFAHLIETLSH